MNRMSGKRPEHEAIYERVKELILFGEFVPGQPITILGLAETLGAGITPVREAIRRLTAEGALVKLENRRVEVPVMTIQRLGQIELVRMAVEPALVSMAANNCSEDKILELERVDAQVDQAIAMGDIRGYLEANFRFHFALYQAADSDILLRIAESLWLQFGPSLRVVCGRFGTSNLKDQHREATAALRKGASDQVEIALRKDIRQGLDFVRNTLT
jgi:DNA-binding GntR family transcriptional regulator